LQRLQQECSAVDVYMRPVEEELAFSGTVEFAVPVRKQKQLHKLLASLALKGVVLFKKCRPVQRVCTRCWKSGHSVHQCSSKHQCCKHCGSEAHRHETGKLMDSLCPSRDQPQASWPPCRLCNKHGHCITSCSAFRPLLVHMQLKPKQALPKAADFPVPAAVVTVTKPVAAALAAATSLAPSAPAPVSPPVPMDLEPSWSTVVKKRPSQKLAAKGTLQLRPSAHAVKATAAKSAASVIAASAPAVSPSAAGTPRPGAMTMDKLAVLVMSMLDMLRSLDTRVTDLTQAQNAADGFAADDVMDGLEEGEVTHFE